MITAAQRNFSASVNARAWARIDAESAEVGRRSINRSSSLQSPFLRIPPFPGSKVNRFAGHGIGSDGAPVSKELLRELKVGGTFWGAQPKLPKRYVLSRSSQASRLLEANTSDPTILWSEAPRDEADVPLECDPWHMVAGATMLVGSELDDVCLIASLSGVAVFLLDESRSKLRAFTDCDKLYREAMEKQVYISPYTGAPMSTIEAAQLCGFWRRLIDSNRDLDGGLGFAFWKRDHIAPLLWAGDRDFRFLSDAHEAKMGRKVAVWRARVGAQQIAQLKKASVELIEVEDGFLRSQGLGADCIPPLSIVVDRLGPHFDPNQPSELELLIESADFDESMLDRARSLREAIVAAGLGKYERGSVISNERLGGDRRHILVLGQVEDDRAVQLGGCGLVSNLELLARVRRTVPDAYVIYKPHPDVVAGHRTGAIPRRSCLGFADEIAESGSISSLIEMADEVHVNTSLAGFEALLREKPVTTYGVPFYAGWGLTTDLGPVPGRRTTRRSIDELVAATLLLYPRYLDPVSGLPCSAEILVKRLSVSADTRVGTMVTLRRLQGKLMRGLRSLVS